MNLIKQYRMCDLVLELVSGLGLGLVLYCNLWIPCIQYSEKVLQMNIFVKVLKLDFHQKTFACVTLPSICKHRAI